MIGHDFPYLDTRDLNLDWLLKNMKQLLQDWATYQQTMNQNFDNLQAAVNQFKRDITTAFDNLHDYVEDYFDNLNVQQEINNKLNAMKLSGELAEIMNPLIASQTATWLSAHITNPSNPPIDTSLSVSGAAADAKVTGDNITSLNDAINDNQELLKKFGLLSIDGSEYYNMYDPDAEGNVYNGYYDRTNTFVPSSARGMTDYIWINGSMKITTNNASNAYSLWYDENKNFIGYIDPQETGYYIPPDGAVYCRIPILLSSIGSFYVHCEELRIYDLSKLTGLYQYYQPLNLFNKNSEDNLMNGYYSDGTTFNQSTTLGQTELIPVKGAHYYKTNFNNVFALWYNEDESYGGQISYQVDRSAKYMMPINAHYARFIFGIATYTEFTVYETDSSYEPLDSVDAPFTFDVQEVVNARGEFNTLSERLAAIDSSEWYGLQGVAFGTSLTYRAQTTGGYLQYLPALSEITFDNQGIGSATILAREGYPSLDILARIKSYASFADKRVCILEGFVNDFYYNYDKLGNWYDTAETSVCGCVRSAINYIYSQNANISLFVVLDHYGKGITASTAKNANNQTQFEYYEEIGKCIESLGVHIIWENKESEISENTLQYLLDNIHLNDLGARQSARTIWSGMKKWLPNVVSA